MDGLMSIEATSHEALCRAMHRNFVSYYWLRVFDFGCAEKAVDHANS